MYTPAPNRELWPFLSPRVALFNNHRSFDEVVATVGYWEYADRAVGRCRKRMERFFRFPGFCCDPNPIRASEQQASEEPPHPRPLPKQLKKIYTHTKCPYWPMSSCWYSQLLWSQVFCLQYLGQIYAGTCPCTWSGRSIPAALVGCSGKSLQVSP